MGDGDAMTIAASDGEYSAELTVLRKGEANYGGMGYFAALAITLFLAAFVRITIVNGGVQMVIYFPCTHGYKTPF